jgi:Icc-related predicted phosphoesterase
MKIAAISDTHGKHEKLEMLPADVLICAGDFTNLGRTSEIISFNHWLGKIKYLYPSGIIVIPGNHDKMFETNPGVAKELITNAKVLIDEEGEVGNGLAIWGSPASPTFGYDWAFNYDTEETPVEERKGRSIIPIWEQIPFVDILVTHGPPKGILDRVSFDGSNVGCPHLKERFQRISPGIHIFGHIHCNDRIAFDGKTIFVNAAICDDYHNVKYNQPVIVELL